MLLLDPTAALEVLIDVGGRCTELRLLELLDAAGFFINGNESVPDMLAVDGRLIWLEGRENGRGCVIDVGVLMKLLMLLIRAWLRAVDRRGALDFRSAFDLASLAPTIGRDSWLAFAMSSNAFAGRSGT